MKISLKDKICYVIAISAFIALLAFTGTAENGGDMKEYAIKAIVCLLVMGVAVLATKIKINKPKK